MWLAGSWITHGYMMVILDLHTIVKAEWHGLPTQATSKCIVGLSHKVSMSFIAMLLFGHLHLFPSCFKSSKSLHLRCASKCEESLHIAVSCLLRFLPHAPQRRARNLTYCNSFQPQAPHRHDTNPAAGPSNMCQMAHLRARRPISAEHPSRETAATNLGPQFLHKSLSIPIGWMSVLVSHIRDTKTFGPGDPSRCLELSRNSRPET